MTRSRLSAEASRRDHWRGNLRRALGACSIAAICLGLGPGCKRNATSQSQTESSATPQAAVPELPPLELKDDTPNLLLTYVDEQGDFHVVQKPEDVPEAAREKVRVVLTTQQLGTGEQVYVADLRNKRPDGTYAVGTFSRKAWDELGASKREARLEALAPGGTHAGGKDDPHTGPLSAIVYGADWCRPCHQAESFLKGLGVKVTKKDIEKSPAAAKEMQGKLAKIRRQGASIPVIDVMGQIFVGFSPVVLKRVVKRFQAQRFQAQGTHERTETL